MLCYFKIIYFVNLRFLVLIICSFLLSSNEPLISGYQFGGEQKLNKKKVRETLTIDDFSYPMAFNNEIYDFLTVAVYGTAAPGSGVIIARNENDYYVLTANHVVGEILQGDVIEVQTLDGEFHTAKLLQFDNAIDGALIKFSSSKSYYPAFIHPEVNPKTGMYILTTGYALASKEATRGSLRRSTGPIVTVIDENKDGYDLLYDAATNVGMSGGPIFSDLMQTNIQGKGWDDNTGAHPCFGFSTPILVGIHGRAESYRAGGKSGASMGISIHTLLSKFGQTLFEEGIKSLPDEEDTLIYVEGCPLYSELKKLKGIN